MQTNQLLPHRFHIIIIIFLFCCCLLISCSQPKDWQLGPFVKADSVNPVLEKDSIPVFQCPLAGTQIAWQAKDVFNPAAIVRNDTVFLLFRAEDLVGKYAGTSRIGLAYSTDGLNFTRHPIPVLYPDNDAYKPLEWEGGCEDPRLVQREDGLYIMTYTAYDGDKARLLVASSPDLYHWTKYGHAFAKAYDGKYVNKWSKSGAIVADYRDGKITAAKLNGKYWMYWGDVNIWAATSDDLINWTPVLYSSGEKPEIPLRRNAGEIAEVKIVFGPREKKFDSDLVEPGPAAMLTDKGILLIYNSRNVIATGDTSLPDGTYAAGQIVMDKNDPLKVIERSESYFMKPDKNYELTGQVNNVCFLEGLVNYKGKWFLYYGTADSKIAVAISE
ncbi:MAG: glycoside hydrolase family 130 protein [Chitinophagaceae bacterium]